MNPLAIQGGIQVLTGIAGLFKRKGKPMENVEAALETVGQFVQKDVKTDPEAVKLVQDHELEMEREYSKQAVGALAVMKSEAESADPVVRRARPLMLYCGYAIMLCQMVIFPAFGVKLIDYVDKEIIGDFYRMFTLGFLGYGVLRTADKKGSKITDLFGGKK